MALQWACTLTVSESPIEGGSTRLVALITPSLPGLIANSRGSKTAPRVSLITCRLARDLLQTPRIARSNLSTDILVYQCLVRMLNKVHYAEISAFSGIALTMIHEHLALPHTCQSRTNGDGLRCRHGCEVRSIRWRAWLIRFSLPAAPCCRCTTRFREHRIPTSGSHERPPAMRQKVCRSTGSPLCDGNLGSRLSTR